VSAGIFTNRVCKKVKGMQIQKGGGRGSARKSKKNWVSGRRGVVKADARKTQYSKSRAGVGGKYAF